MTSHVIRPLVCLSLLGFVPSLFAQSAVTLYGQSDIAVRYARNHQGGGTPLLSLGGGGLFSNKFGVKGKEELGSGNHLLLQLEGGFSTDTGSLAAQSPVPGRTNLFGRQSFIGITGDWGQLTAGRQYNALTVLYQFHPVGDHFYVGGDHFFSGYRLGNSLAYKKKSGDFSVELNYGFGERPGGLAQKSTVGGNIEYQRDGFHTAVAYLQNRSVDGGTVGRTANVGASYALTPALKLYGGYAGHQERGGTRRNRDIAFISAGYKINSQWAVHGSLYHFRQSSCQGRCWKRPGDQDNVSSGVDTTMTGYAISSEPGHANMASLISTYDLSQRTTLYAATDWVRARRGAAQDHYYMLSSQNRRLDSLSQTHLVLGMRHAF